MLKVSETTEAFVNAMNALDKLAYHYDLLAEKYPSKGEDYRKSYEAVVAMREMVAKDGADYVSISLLGSSPVVEL